MEINLKTMRPLKRNIYTRLPQLHIYVTLCQVKKSVRPFCPSFLKTHRTRDPDSAEPRRFYGQISLKTFFKVRYATNDSALAQFIHLTNFTKHLLQRVHAMFEQSGYVRRYEIFKRKWHFLFLSKDVRQFGRPQTFKNVDGG